MRVSSAEVGTSPDRRTFLKLAAASPFALSEALRSNGSIEAAEKKVRNEAMQVLMVWLPGGISSKEFLDPDPPGTPPELSGPFSSVQTASSAMRFSEPWEQLAPYANMMSIVKSIHNGNIGHDEGAKGALLGGGTLPVGHLWGNAIRQGRHQIPYSLTHSPREEYSFSGAHAPSLAVEMTWQDTGDYTDYTGIYEFSPDTQTEEELPIPVYATEGHFSTGFSQLRDEQLQQLNRRASLLNQLESQKQHNAFGVVGRQVDNSRELSMSLLTGSSKLSRLKGPTDKELRQYGGDTYVARQLILARNLIESDVQFVTTSLAVPHQFVDWDHHSVIGKNMTNAAAETAPAIAALFEDLRSGKMRPTLVVLASEMSRTAEINNFGGRHHSDLANPLVLAAPDGYAIKGGSVYGERDVHGNVTSRKLDARRGAVRNTIMYAAANGNQKKFPKLLSDVRDVPLGIMLHS